MYCYKCGAEIENTAMFCPHCGVEISANDQSDQQHQAPRQPYTPLEQKPDLKMGWYKFLIYFSLFAGAVLNVLDAISLLTGGIYDGAAELVYAVFSSLKGLDTFIGIATLGLAGMCIYTRFRLSGFYKNGPMMLNITYIASLAVNLIYIIGLSSIVPDIISDASTVSSQVSSTITSVMMIFVNTAYFKKRSHLFVNE